MANHHPRTDQLKPWPKGTSGNPAGSSRKQRLGIALARALEERGLEAQYVKVGLAAALLGDFSFWRYIFERIDGKLPDPDDGDGQDVEAILEAARAQVEGRRANRKGGDR
jgi:hypothetical protein